MKRFIIFLVVIILGAAIFLLTQLPVVTGRGTGEVKRMIEKVESISLFEKTLFISDVHLISGLPIEDQFNLDFSDVRNLVIVGDFFHTPEHFAKYGDSETESLRNVLSDFVPEDFSGQIFFINGESHDPILSNVNELIFDNFTFRYLGEYGKFDVDGAPVVAFHGQQIHTGIIGGGISWIARSLGYPLPLERLARRRFGIDEATWLITGHSHVPAIQGDRKMANTGSFVGAPFNKYIFKIHIGTGILFDGEKVELLEFQDLNIKNLYIFAI